MYYKRLNIQINDSIISASINEVTNKVDLMDLASELEDLCVDINSSKEIRVFIITGNNESLCSLRTISEQVQIREKHCVSLAKPIAKLSLPVISAFNGNVFGQCLELMLACDLRIVADNAIFCFTQIEAGLIPSDGGTQRLPRIVGRAKAAEMIYTCAKIDAPEAQRICLVHNHFPESRLIPEVTGMARKIAAQSPVALQMVKEAVYKGMDMTLEQGLQLEADLYFLLHTTHDRLEGISAYREKRQPRFEGK